MNDSSAIHRLVDMVVEEVSLVDRAANKHRFLIVKRSDPMKSDAPKDGQPAADVASPPNLITAAVAALEGLTEAVEILHANGSNPPRLAELASELQGLAAKLVGEDASTEASTEDTTPDDAGSAVASIRATLARVTTMVNEATSSTAKPAAEPSAAEPASTDAVVTDQLADVAKALHALTTTVRAQQQRIAQVEKQFGLPNSAQSDERAKPVAPESVGWPMDMNNPMDRESVDKSVSFHDV